MSECSNLVTELREIHESEDAWHGPELRKILSGIDFRKAAARPVSDHRSIWELVLHISKWEEVFCLRLEGREIREPLEGDWPAAPEQTESAWQNALRFLDETHERIVRIVSKLDDSNLDQLVVGKDFTTGYMLHGIVRHHVYHSGQIAILKRI